MLMCLAFSDDFHPPKNLAALFYFPAKKEQHINQHTMMSFHHTGNSLLPELPGAYPAHGATKNPTFSQTTP
jgi:hypothetical protein